MIIIEDIDSNKPFAYLFSMLFLFGTMFDLLIPEIVGQKFHYLCPLLFPSDWVHWDALK